MRILILSFLFLSCSHQPPKFQNNDKDLVTLKIALDQAQASYLRGCVEAFQELKFAPSFSHCVEKSKTHRLELDMIMAQDPQ